MINLLSIFLSKELVKRNIVKQDQIDMYEYGIYQFLNYFILLFTILFVGIMRGNLTLTIMFSIGIYSLRIMTGGIHLPNNLLCFLVSFIFLNLLNYLLECTGKLSNMSQLFLFEFSWVLMLTLPFQFNSNSLINQKEISYINQRKAFLLIIYQLIFLSFYFLDFNNLKLLLLITSFINLLSILLSLIVNFFQRLIK